MKLQKKICFIHLSRSSFSSTQSTEEGRSVLYNKNTTALLGSQEYLAWGLTCLWLGNYYRTYSKSVEAEVKSVLAHKSQFQKGKAPITRDSKNNLSAGFSLQDGNYLSARWPGDAHNFGYNFLKLL